MHATNSNTTIVLLIILSAINKNVYIKTLIF